MAARLPLFPLGLVLFPGRVLPLHVFEDRYRVLVRELLERPRQERRFGVVTIREGREVGADGVRALHEVGCAALLRRVDRYADGRFDIVTVGAERFRLTGLAAGTPYLTGVVEWLPDEAGPVHEARVLGRAVRARYRAYATTLAAARSAAPDVPELPDDPVALSYLVAATLLVDLAERQALLAAPDGASRLRAELALLRRESTLLRVLAAVPSPELARGPVSPN